MLYVLNSRMFAYSAILLIAKFSTVRMLYLPVAVKLTIPYCIIRALLLQLMC